MTGQTSTPHSFEYLRGSTDDELVELFHWWFIPHRDGRYLRRNLLLAAGNSGAAAAVTAIEAHLGHRSSMIRSHAAWALAQALPSRVEERLREALATERAPETRRELAFALTMVQSERDYRALLALDELSRTVL